MSQEIVREGEALKILRKNRFLSAQRVVLEWNRLIREKRTPDFSISLLEVSEEVPIFYFKETIEDIAGDKNWCLIYDPGFSLRDSLAILGIDFRYSPNYDKKINRWWLSKREDQWAVGRGLPRYYLIRMEGLFGKKSWPAQELSIQAQGRKFYRASCRIVANLSLAYYLLNNKSPMKRQQHWGSEDTFDEQKVIIDFTKGTFKISHWPFDCQAPDLKVCIVRKFDV